MDDCAEHARQHDPDQVVPSETGPADAVRPAPGGPGPEAGTEDIEARHPAPPVGRPAAPSVPSTAPPPRHGFWRSLTEIEQAALLAFAEEVFYPVGTVLWTEGQPADQAVVIRSGSIRVSVHRDGHERIIAFRGPGDIIGERAALLLRRRSATIVAMDTVHGLRMTTQQLAVYLSNHPRVLAVLEREMYDRLTEQTGSAPQAPMYGPAAEYGPAAPPGPHVPHPRPAGGSAHLVTSPGDASRRQVHPVPAARVPSHEQATQPMAVNPPGPAAAAWTGQNCTIVYTDIAGFSESHRNDRDRLGMRRAMYAVLREAFEESSVPWDACHIEDRGDGALIVVPPEVPTAAVIDPMIASLAMRLRRHNERASGAVRIQLRVAADVGPVMPDPPGVNGFAIIRTARLLNARPLKERLAATGADLGFVASQFVYESVIAHSPGYVDPAEYEPISCRVKKLKIEGWIHLRGVSAQSAV